MKERKASLGSLDYLDFEVTRKPWEEAGLTEKGGGPNPLLTLYLLIETGDGAPWESSQSAYLQMPRSVKRLIGCRYNNRMEQILLPRKYQHLKEKGA